MRSTRALGTLALSALLAAGCSPAAHRALPDPTSPPGAPHDSTRGKAAAAALTRFQDCRALTSAMRAEALSEVTAFGLPGSGAVVPMGDGPAIPASAADSVGPAAAAGAPLGAQEAARAAAPAAAGFSGTNNQEAGVDEPDLVKTDGHLLLVLRHRSSTLEAVDVSGSAPRRLSHLTVQLPAVSSLLLSGRIAVVLGQRYESSRAVTTAEVYDVGDGSAMTHLRTFRVTGQLLDARFVHGRIVLVAQSAPALRWAYPTGRGGQPESLRANQAVIRSADARQWLPSVRVTPHLRTYEAQCDATYRPARASGLATTSVVTLDPGQDAPTQDLTVVGGSSVMYASTAALYLTTTAWADKGAATQVHGFDITDPDHIGRLGSGSVAGTLTDQYALSEDNGFLRVATTVGSPAPPRGERVGPAAAALSDNRVTILQPKDGVLTPVGEVRGLGRGQRIVGVRFLGDVGYVVTFRSIDPLYAVDLSDPRHPAVRGELHVSGFSSALFPLGGGQLLGLGQAVGDRQQEGAQAEVFDVGDLDHPALTGRLVWPAATSLAQQDHHALLWWPSRRLAVLPLQSYRDGASSAAVLRIDSDGTVREVGRVRTPHAGWGAQVERAVIVGDLLYSVTDDGLVVAPLDNVDDATWLPFG
jgi:uncharacterized secreted protein with C-terminal beta-propeller domain